MTEKEKQEWLEQAEKMMQQSAGIDEGIAALRRDVHGRVAAHLFHAFPFLADAMEPEDIRLLGDRIHRHLHSLTEELANFAYTVQQRGA